MNLSLLKKNIKDPKGESISSEILEDKLPITFNENIGSQKESKTQENIYIKRQLSHQGFKNSSHKGGISRIENYMDKKIPLEEKIELRNKETISNSELWKRIKLRNQAQNNGVRQKANSCYYNHLSPNRNFNGFEYLFKPRLFNRKLKKYYHNIIFDNI